MRAGRATHPGEDHAMREDPRMRWFPMSWCLSNHDWSEYIKKTWPHVYVNGDAIKNSPTKDDPLGARPFLAFGHNSDNQTFQVRLFDESSPWLTPDAVEAYLYIHWPEYFRRGSNGQAPE